MQQPLCHLYFLTVLEHLWSEHHRTHSKLSILVCSAKNIQKQLQDTAQEGETVLLQVELQAVVQLLIWQLALHLDPSQTQRLGDVQLILEDINKSV